MLQEWNTLFLQCVFCLHTDYHYCQHNVTTFALPVFLDSTANINPYFITMYHTLFVSVFTSLQRRMIAHLLCNYVCKLNYKASYSASGSSVPIIPIFLFAGTELSYCWNLFVILTLLHKFCLSYACPYHL